MGLIRAWSEVARRPTHGLVYRELARQVPEWNARAPGQIVDPNPFAFLDYAILQPGVDSRAVADAEVASCDVVEALYEVKHVVRARDPRDDAEMILFNLFDIEGPPPMVHGFATSWLERARFMTRQDGCVSATLHHRRDGNLAPTVFNRAEWRSAVAYEASLGAFDAAFPRSQRVAAPPGSAGGRITSRLGLFRLMSQIVPSSSITS